MSTCVCPQGLLHLEDSLDEYITREIHLNASAPGLLHLKEVSIQYGMDVKDIVDVRFNLARYVPFKLGGCNANLRCCGQCMKRCTKRCVQDVLYRFYMMLNGPDSNVYTIAAKGLQKREHITYEQVRLLVEDQLCIKSHKQLRKYSENFHNVANFAENPYRYNYEPRKLMDTNGPVTDPITHEVQLQDWPDSGLCPYCLPSRMVIRRRSEKDRRG